MLTSPAYPFIIEHLKLDQKAGHFTPAARLIVTAALRESGLLAALPPEQAALLLTLLTFLSPNGRVEATLEQIAAARAVSPAQAEGALQALAQLTFADLPLVQVIAHEQSVPVYRLSTTLFAHEEVAAPPEAGPVLRFAERADVIAHTRLSYARPRAEAEAEVDRQLGVHPEENAESPEGEIRRHLLAIGVARPDIDRLIAEYSLARIQDQIAWLPLRHARMPARYLIAAIEENYAPPIGARLAESSEVIPTSDPGVAEGSLPETADLENQIGDNIVPEPVDDAT